MDASIASEAPGPKGLPLLGSTLDAWKDPLAFMTGSLRDHGNIVQFRFGPFRYMLVNEIAAVKHILVDNAKNYTKSRNYKGLKLLLGEGLLTSEGDFWRRQRKLAQPAFHRERLAGFVDTMAQSTSTMLGRWASSPSTAMDVHAEMMRLTFQIAGLTLLSTDLDDSADAVGKSLAFLLPFANDYAESLMPIPPWVPTPNNLRFQRAARTLNEMVFGVIRERRANPEGGSDLLSMLMEAKDESGEGMTDLQLRDEVMTMVLAGHETTANAMAWTFYLLSKHPEAARRVDAEVAEVLGGRAPRLEDLGKLSYTQMVIQESLRLYPPAWAFERQAILADQVSGFTISKGMMIGICPYALHRNTDHWEKPEGFDPERFMPERAAARPRYAYLPFGGGPRFCIGSAFAMMEAQVILAMVAQKHRLELVPGTRVEPVAEITLRPGGGIPMERRPRIDAAQAPRARAMRSLLSAASVGVIPTG